MHSFGRATHAATYPVCVHGVTVAYDRRPVLWDVDVDIEEGKITGIIGPNGAGKTTLMRAVLDLVPRTSGTVSIYGESYSKNRQLVAYVPQRETVDWEFPVSALDVVVMGRYGRIGWCRRPKKQDLEAAKICLEQVGMAEFADRQIRQLSGGQQQRVFLARALAQEARIFFLDEPFAGVDAATERAIIQLLNVMRGEGKTIVAVHHDLQSVKTYFDNIIMLNMRLVAAGPTSLVFTDENLRRTYGGRLTLLDEASYRVARAPEAKL